MFATGWAVAKGGYEMPPKPVAKRSLKHVMGVDWGAGKYTTAEGFFWTTEKGNTIRVDYVVGPGMDIKTPNAAMLRTKIGRTIVLLPGRYENVNTNGLSSRADKHTASKNIWITQNGSTPVMCQRDKRANLVFYEDNARFGYGQEVWHEKNPLYDPNLPPFKHDKKDFFGYVRDDRPEAQELIWHTDPMYIEVTGGAILFDVI